MLPIKLYLSSIIYHLSFPKEKVPIPVALSQVVVTGRDEPEPGSLFLNKYISLPVSEGIFLYATP
jgi:hypothetical protein